MLLVGVTIHVSFFRVLQSYLYFKLVNQVTNNAQHLFFQDSQKDNRPPSPPRPQEPPPPQPPLPPMAPGTNIQIRKDYNPKQAKAPVGAPTPDNYLISPITGERVPSHEFDEHMKISLLDPKWKEQRDRFEAEKKQHESVFASGEWLAVQCRSRGRTSKLVGEH